MLDVETNTFDPHTRAHDARLAATLAALDNDGATAAAWLRVSEALDLRPRARRRVDDARASASLAIRAGACP